MSAQTADDTATAHAQAMRKAFLSKFYTDTLCYDQASRDFFIRRNGQDLPCIRREGWRCRDRG